MARKMFKCPKCNRSFSMKAHLGRHLSAIHGSKRSKTTRRNLLKRGRPSVRVVSGRASASDGSERIVAQMQEYHRELLVQRRSLDAEIVVLTRAMQTMGAAAPSRAPRRSPKRGRPPVRHGTRAPLKDSIVNVLRQQSRPMRPGEIAAHLKKAGFKSKARDLAKSVSNRLSELKMVKKVGVGMYRL